MSQVAGHQAQNMNAQPSTGSNMTLDPSDWKNFRLQAHDMLDDMVEYIEDIRKRPVWQPIPNAVRARLRTGLPELPTDLAAVHNEFMQHVLPFAAGNVHPGFMGWVHGGGTPVGMLAEMLAAGLNANLGGRDHTPIEVERQVVQWVRELFGFPQSATGLFVTGTSMANLIAVIVARDVELGFGVRQQGIAANSKRLTAYGSTAVHGCIAKAMDLSGLGSDALRTVATDSRHRIGIEALEQAIHDDRRAGFTPFLVVGSAGTVDTGAIDDLASLANLCQREGLWFHVDGAYGALAMLAPDLAPRLKGIERADSLAFDFHKWGQVPYDAGFILVRNGQLHQRSFDSSAVYLKREVRGLAAGAPWPCDFGPDLSRGFHALKTWFTLKVHGTKALGAVISRSCELARYLEARIAATAELELLAPVELNIVCFRYRTHDSDRINAQIVVDLQECGSVAPSTTTIHGQLAIRAAIVNHRTSCAEIDILVDETLALGRAHQTNSAPRPAAQLRREHEAFDNRYPRNNFRMEHLLNPSAEPSIHQTGSILSLAPLLTHAFSGTDLTPLANQWIEDARRSRNANTLLDLSLTLELLRKREPALAIQGDALKLAQHFRVATKSADIALRLLVLKAPGDLSANTPIECLLENTSIAVELLYVGQGFPLPEALPEHDLLFVAVAESNENRPVLEYLQHRLTVWPRPYLNAPREILKLERGSAGNFLSFIPGIVMPHTSPVDRATLQQLAHGELQIDAVLTGEEFPVIVRPVDSHAGRGLIRAESPTDLLSYLNDRSDAEFFISRFIDYSSADGLFRKYRIVMMDGQPFLCHMGISDHWMVHYPYQEMISSATRRAEEERAMTTFDEDFARRHRSAFAAIHKQIQLDYFGLDCAESINGDLVIFEAASAMLVHAMDDPDIFPYKKVQMRKVLEAFRRMLCKHPLAESEVILV